MNTSIRIFPPLMLCVGLALPLAAQDEVSVAASDRDNSALVTLSATVESIDLEKREVTLRSPSGSPITLAVDKRVQRLNEVKVGDKIDIDYYVSIATEVRAPTAEEKQNALQVVEDVRRAPTTESPAGGVLRMTKAVTTVEGIDRSVQSLTLRGPRGNVHTVKVKDPSKLEGLKIGDTVMVLFTEALAVSLQKRKETLE